MSIPFRSVLIAGALLSFAACSSDGSSSELDVPGEQVVPTVTAAPTTAVPATTVPPTAPATTSAPSPSTTQVPATSEAPATTAAPATTDAPTTTESNVVYYRSGDEGPEVAVLQLKLETVGFLASGYTVGVFDSATNGAVLEFQGQYGLIVDGIVGPETERALTAAAVSVNPESS